MNRIVCPIATLAVLNAPSFPETLDPSSFIKFQFELKGVAVFNGSVTNTGGAWAQDIPTSVSAIL